MAPKKAYPFYHASAWVNIVSECKRKAWGGSDGFRNISVFLRLTFSMVVYLALWNDVQKQGVRKLAGLFTICW
jgi:hypothetical protein